MVGLQRLVSAGVTVEQQNGNASDFYLWTEKATSKCMLQVGCHTPDAAEQGQLWL
jgi:hypothetical protein